MEKINFNGTKEDLYKCGIYAIVNLTNEKKYIGSAVSFGAIFDQHNSALKNNKHCNCILQNAYNKQGANNFEFQIVEISDVDISKNELLKIEQFYLNKIFESINYNENYYNIAKNAMAPMKNRKHSAESIEKIRLGSMERNKGEKNFFFGKNHSEETKLKMSLASKGKRTGKNNSNYISEIIAINNITGEEMITSSYQELAEKLNVSKSTIQTRLNKNHKKYTKTPIKNIWIVSRILS